MSRICPHCHYARQTSDTAPDWQCPSCERAYAKAGAVLPPETLRQYAPATRAESGGKGKWLLLLLALGAAVWFGRPLWQQHALPAMMATTPSEQPEVVLYATSWCGYCKLTREFFAANGIRYTEQDIEQSSTALMQHRKLGGNGVPLVVIGDEIVNGWNEQSLRQLLGPWMRR